MVAVAIPHLMMDVDGVLVTGRPGDGAPWKTDLQQDLGLCPERLHREFFVPYWSEIVTGQKPLRPVLDQALGRIAPQLSATDLIEYWFANDAGLDLRVLDDVRALRDQGVKVFLATNQENLRAQYLWNHVGLRDHADGLITSADLGVAKPEPLFFDRAMLRTNADPSAHLLIDDSQLNVKAAQSCGWKAAHWTGAQRLKDISAGWP